MVSPSVPGPHIRRSGAAGVEQCRGLLSAHPAPGVLRDPRTRCEAQGEEERLLTAMAKTTALPVPFPAGPRPPVGLLPCAPHPTPRHLLWDLDFLSAPFSNLLLGKYIFPEPRDCPCQAPFRVLRTGREQSDGRRGMRGTHSRSWDMRPEAGGTGAAQPENLQRGVGKHPSVCGEEVR